MSILRVKEAFAVLSDPSGHVYSPGDLVDESDPVVKGRSQYFEAVEGSLVDALQSAKRPRRRNRGRTETASAAPGAIPKPTPATAPVPAPAPPTPAPSPAPKKEDKP